MDVPDPDTVPGTTDATFGVPPADLIATPPDGYDLAMMRSLATEGQVTPISVKPAEGGRFEVVGDQKQLAAIRMLIRFNGLAYDIVRGLLGPASSVFALVSCRIRARSKASTSQRLGRVPPPNEPPIS